MPMKLRGIRLASLLMAVAVIAVILGLGVQFYRAVSPVRRWIAESRPGKPSRMRMQAVLNLTYAVPQAELEEGFPVLLAAAKDADPWVRASAARALAGRREHSALVIPILLGLLKDNTPRVRECAILGLEALVKPGSPESATLVPELLASLDDTKPAVRLEACRALQVQGRLLTESQRVVPAMTRIIREEKGTYRLDALGYLTMIKIIPKELEPQLRAHLSSGIPDERISAVRALILMGIPDQERDALLESMVESQHLNERFTGAAILIEIGKPDLAIPVLRGVIASDNTAMRARARVLLCTLNEPEEAP
jgi:HEAT repeat protein